MEEGNRGGGGGGGVRDHNDDLSDLERFSFTELLYGVPPPSVIDGAEFHHHDPSVPSWAPPEDNNFNFSYQNPSTHQFIPPFSIPSNSYATCSYVATKNFPSIQPSNDQNQFNFGAKSYMPPIENLAVEKPDDDGYNWRKYGQKQLKDGKYPKSYYKCTSPGCPVKKTVERSSEGHITDITYQGRHNHEAAREIEACNNEEEIFVSEADQEGMSGSIDSNEMGNSEVIIDSADSEMDNNCRVGSVLVSSGSKKREPKIIFETRSKVDLIDDGYRWRKYGQKSVKGNPHPRSYYKCTHTQCNVRKQIERASRDPNLVLTTYEGKHTHDPAPLAVKATSTSHDTIQPIVSNIEANRIFDRTGNLMSDSGQQHAMHNQMKEEVFFTF